jgi:8-amino-7-oxononanoate synthase
MFSFVPPDDSSFLFHHPRNPMWRERLRQDHTQRKADSLWRQRVVVESAQGREVTIDGKVYLNFCSNDYLGLASHPALTTAAINATKKMGTGSGASHLVCGHMTEHHQLELELADFVRAEQAIVFSTGYMANLAIPQSLLGRNDLVLSDRLNHASLIDAGQHAPSKMKRYQHLSVEEVSQRLSDSDATGKMVMTDGVFSMDGDIAPVDRLQAACLQHDALLVIDDAHGFGVIGENGRGTIDHFGLRPRGNLLMMGTLGKSAGSFGAFVAGDEILIQSLVQYARTYIYTTALPPSVVAAARAAIRLIETEPDRREALATNIEYFRKLCSVAKLDLVDSSTAIQPIIFGNSESALRASEQLKKYGIWVTAIRPPTVPTPRLRITLSAQHTQHDIKALVNSLQLINIAEKS